MSGAQKKTTSQNDLGYYKGLKYPIEITEDDGAYIASVVDLPGCISYGDTLDEAVQNLNSIKELWIAGRIQSGQEVPEPTKIEDFSGKFVLRIPRALHRSLDREAKRQGVSLNQYVAHLLSERHREEDLKKLIESFNPVVCAGSSSCPAARSGWVYKDELSYGAHRRRPPHFGTSQVWAGVSTQDKITRSTFRSEQLYKCWEGSR